MAKYTTEIRTLVESGFNFGLKDYPIFDENYRDSLNQKIIDHYFFREIGFETAEMFRRYLNRQMNEIMPYYNKLYQSELITFQPLINRKLSETVSRNTVSDATQQGSGTQSTESVGENVSKGYNSDFPQSPINIEDTTGEIYASTGTTDTSRGNTTTQANSSTSAESLASTAEDYSRQYEGFEGDQSEMLLNYRKTLLNIDMLVIKELNNLFMGIW